MPERTAPAASTYTPLARFQARWSGGCGASVCSRPGTRVCLGRGSIPCDVLFIGEAPGRSENALGLVFIGPAGKLMDRIVEAAFSSLTGSISWAFTNLIGCMPSPDSDGGEVGQPADADVRQCSTRLYEFVELCRPKVIITVGAVPRDWLEQGLKDCVKLPLSHHTGKNIPLVNIDHPARVLRANYVQKDLIYQRMVVALRDVAEKLTKGAEVVGDPAKPEAPQETPEVPF